jgi:hypothetical protein
MDREQIIRMAREAGFSERDAMGRTAFLGNSYDIERFAALVAAHEREACAELVWPTQQVKVWSDKELTDMTVAFNRTQEKHGYGWYETIMAVGATALKDRAAAIRARGGK